MGVVHRGGWDARFAQRSEWLWPLERAAALLETCREWPSLAELDAVYAALVHPRAELPLRFAADVRSRRRDKARRIEDRYDARIALSATVPTRERNWHDLLNALCFATWPRSKRALHARQLEALQRRGHGQREGTRTPEQDALTLFDEGGVVIAALDEDASELRASLARGELGEIVRLERERRARVAPFGHALLEHVVAGVPCPGAAARVIALPALPADAGALLDQLDLLLVRELERRESFLAPAESAHLRLAELERARVASSADVVAGESQTGKN